MSNTIEPVFCVDVRQEVLYNYNAPEIFNTDHGAQFTSNSFNQVLKANHVAISMYDRVLYQGNIFVERLCWTLKHQYVYLHSSTRARYNDGAWSDGFGIAISKEVIHPILGRPLYGYPATDDYSEPAALKKFG